MRSAIVIDDRIVNVIEVDDLSFPVDGELIEAPIESLQIGFERREGKWGNPENQDFIDHEWRDREPKETVEHHPSGEI